MARTTFLFNSQSSSSFGIQVVDVDHPEMPELRQRRVIVPGRNGEWDFGVMLAPTTITFTCWNFEEDRPTLRVDLENIATWLNPQADNGQLFPGYAELVISYESSHIYIARFDGKMEFKQMVGYGTYKLPFLVNPLTVG